MGTFNDIPVRLNGDDIEAGWFNTVRTALIAVFGGIVGQTLYENFNNKTSWTNIPGLTVVSNVDQAVEVDIYMERSDDTPTFVQTKLAFLLLYSSSTNTWRLIPGRDYGPDDVMGLGSFPFQVVTSGSDPYTGQVQHKSSNMTGGSYDDKLNFKMRTFTP
jgi:hypothetical protein